MLYYCNKLNEVIFFHHVDTVGFLLIVWFQFHQSRHIQLVLQLTHLKECIQKSCQMLRALHPEKRWKIHVCSTSCLTDDIRFVIMAYERKPRH